MIRNQAGQYFTAFAFDVNGHVTGNAANITGRVALDDGVEDDLLTNVAEELENGYYRFPADILETDAHKISLSGVSSTPGVQITFRPDIIITVEPELATGKNTVTFDILSTANALPIEGVDVSLYTDVGLTNRVQRQTSDILGLVTMTAEVGFYYLQRQKTGISYNVEQIEVTVP